MKRMGPGLGQGMDTDTIKGKTVISTNLLDNA